MAAEKITTRTADYSQWYLDIVNHAGRASTVEVILGQLLSRS